MARGHRCSRLHPVSARLRRADRVRTLDAARDVYVYGLVLVTVAVIVIVIMRVIMAVIVTVVMIAARTMLVRVLRFVCGDLCFDLLHVELLRLADQLLERGGR